MRFHIGLISLLCAVAAAGCASSDAADAPAASVPQATLDTSPGAAPTPTTPAPTTSAPTTPAPAASSQTPAHRTSASEPGLDPDYAACVAAVEADPEAGSQKALHWISDGGGPPAIHCAALGELARGLPGSAAARLETLAQRQDAGDALVRARLFSQAAEAWLADNRPDAAETALDAAMKLAPGAGELERIAAKIYAAQGRWQDVVNAITAADKAGYVTAPMYVLRGRAYQALSRYEAASDDVVRALQLDPGNLDALVLRGELRQISGDVKLRSGR